jgi:hypothetical protein
MLGIACLAIAVVRLVSIFVDKSFEQSNYISLVDVARMAAKDTRAIPVTVLDSRQLSLGTGFAAGGWWTIFGPIVMTKSAFIPWFPRQQ